MTATGSYLKESLHGDYAMGSEDRLSQIFSASFNHSDVFRKAVFQFLNISTKLPSKSVTQNHHLSRGESAKLDILLSSSSADCIVIENKINAPLTNHQLKKYDHITKTKHCQKYCFVKHYKIVAEVLGGWRIRYWGDFYISLLTLKEIDFVTANFIEILKEYGMERPHLIKKTDLKALSRALHIIRFKDKPMLTFNGPTFETIVTFKMFLEDVFRKAAKEPILKKKAGKSFRPNMRVSWWYEEKKKGKEWLWIGCGVKLQKAYNEIKSFGAALILYDKENKYDAIVYVEGTDGNWCLPIEYYPKKDINCLEFEKMALKYWSKKLK
jgi:hypothetical protein